MDTAKMNWPDLLRLISWAVTHEAFKHIDVPWLVSKKAIEGTFPGYVVETLPGMYSIGSGEQGFIELELRGELTPGRYVTLTPCFRIEPVLDELHQNYFMKAELYITDNTSVENLHGVITMCQTFFKSLAFIRGYEVQPEIVAKDDGSFDIEINGIEVGSYDIREYEGTRWIYGTLLAEPRFTVALAKGKT